MVRRRARTRGSALIEFTMVGIPIIFVLISVFEVARGMWLYHTLAEAVKSGTRYAAVHGSDCNIPPNNCAVPISTIATRIRDAAVGFQPRQITNVSFASSTRTITCATLAECLTTSGQGGVYWPAGPAGSTIDIGGNRRAPIEVRASYTFQSSMAMFWPGASRIQGFPTVVLPASSREPIEY